MENIFEIRVSDYVLDKVLNPLKCDEYGNFTPDQLNEWCGLIPDFFAAAVTANEPDITKADENKHVENDLKMIALNKVALGMDDNYGYGGFGSSVMTTKPSDFGIIFGEDGEPDLYPIGKFTYKFLEVLQYEYGMVALRIVGKPDTVKFARFD
tara:strand:+ start:100 stop:558 length:459 start_codon:yes stop_codon:yes gene_type:complete